MSLVPHWPYTENSTGPWPAVERQIRALLKTKGRWMQDIHGENCWRTRCDTLVMHNVIETSIMCYVPLPPCSSSSHKLGGKKKSHALWNFITPVTDWSKKWRSKRMGGGCSSKVEGGRISPTTCQQGAWRRRDKRYTWSTCVSWDGSWMSWEFRKSSPHVQDVFHNSNLCQDSKQPMQAWYFTKATKTIASMPPGHCLGALEMIQ